MIIYYYVEDEVQQGSFNETKIKAMAKGREIYTIAYSEFRGHLLSSEWNG